MGADIPVMLVVLELKVAPATLLKIIDQDEIYGIVETFNFRLP